MCVRKELVGVQASTFLYKHLARALVEAVDALIVRESVFSRTGLPRLATESENIGETS